MDKKTIKAPNFPKKLSREEFNEGNKSVEIERNLISTQSSRFKLSSGIIKHRSNFNSNFTAKNSMAKRSFFLDMSKQVSNDFDPSTVYEGVSDIDNELEALEEVIPEEKDDEYTDIDEEIEFLIESNK